MNIDVTARAGMPSQYTTAPQITNPSFIAMKCKEGIVIATSPLGQIHDKLQHKNVNRFLQISDNVVVCTSGDYSDFQMISKVLKEDAHKSQVYKGAKKAKPAEVASHLAHLCYEKRNKQDPYFVQAVVAGINSKGTSELHYVDLYGNHFENPYICSGFSLMICPPIIDRVYNENISFAQAKDLLITCFKALIARHVSSIDEVDFAFLSSQGVKYENERVRIKYDYETCIKKEDFMSTN